MKKLILKPFVKIQKKKSNFEYIIFAIKFVQCAQMYIYFLLIIFFFHPLALNSPSEKLDKKKKRKKEKKMGVFFLHFILLPFFWVNPNTRWRHLYVLKRRLRKFDWDELGWLVLKNSRIFFYIFFLLCFQG